MLQKEIITYFILFFSIIFSAQSQTPVIKIWSNLAPGSEKLENNEQWTDGKSVSDVYQPELTIFLAEHQTALTPAVIVFPGGGYTKIVMEKEGYKAAKWLNENGITAFVLKYRLNREDALRDAQRAVSLVRKEAKKYQIDENKIGVLGFSAGGHLAANLVANYNDRKYHDSIDDISSRPDFWIGVYGNYRNINVHENIPPTFLVHAANDSRVPVMSSIELFTKLKETAIPAELHIYEQGEHGFALEVDRGAAITSTVKNWTERCLEWLKLQGIL